MPIELIYLIVLLVAICLVFVVLKRPIYEAMFFGYIVMIACLGAWGDFGTYLLKISTNTLFYAIIAFLTVAHIFGTTGVIDDCIDVILSLLGRFTGGAGYVALISSTFMGALSGSGAGNVAATGVFTIPAMKKSGFPPELAANVEMSASTMGNMIPPSGVITASFAALALLYPDTYDMSQFWMVCWGVSAWFILQRAITLFAFCKYYKVKPIAKEDLPDLGASLKKGWKALLIPVVIFLPFWLDSQFKTTLFKELIGDGAAAMSSCILLFTPGLAGMYAMLICKDKSKSKISHLAEVMSNTVKGIVPVSATIYFAYAISELFTAKGVGDAIGAWVADLGFSHLALAIFIPLFTALLGMVLPGSSQVAIFGGIFITLFVNVGMNPLVVCAMLPVITGAMEGMTPPLALCMYTAMGIAGSDLKKTTMNCLIWVGLHYALSVVILLGLLPIAGL
ncbi:MAG: TRAP transporter large permease subunit [Oscillospiraceae bacterium]|nr:TRAP transporter large permease subunit [Oscillospiraceae bacterium]